MKKFFTLLLLLFAPLLAAQTCWNTIPESTPSERFHINGSEVLDLRTGLVWQRCPLGLSGSDCQLGTLKISDSWQFALRDARNFAEQENKGWRLPTIKELRSIVEERCLNPAINRTIFPNTVPSNMMYDVRYWGYWSASPHIPVPDRKSLLEWTCDDGYEPCLPGVSLCQTGVNVPPSCGGLDPICCKVFEPPQGQAEQCDWNSERAALELPTCENGDALRCNDPLRSEPSCRLSDGSIICPDDSSGLVCCKDSPSFSCASGQHGICDLDDTTGTFEPFCAGWRDDAVWNQAWIVDFEKGNSMLNVISSGRRVRLVRDY